MRVTVLKVSRIISGLVLVLCVHLFLTVNFRNSQHSNGQDEGTLVAGDEIKRQRRDTGDSIPWTGFNRRIFDSHVNESVPSPSPIPPAKPSREKFPRHNVLLEETNTQTELSDVFISVKTTQKYHKDRVDLLLQTWVMFAQEQTFFFSDADDEEFKKKTKNHLINTNCSSDHTRQALCCKMSVEYDYFIESGKRWFCHVDDDTYVNTGALVRLLRRYNHTQDWYLGKPSLSHPLQIQDKDHPEQKIAFWFATGGAGFCISRGLALKMMPYTSGGRLRSICNHIRLPDDCSIGFIISHKLNKELTVIKGFHSHLEGLWKINRRNLEDQITLSYLCNSHHGSHKPLDSCNSVDITSGFPEKSDPTRFRSIHCLLYPNLAMCQPLKT